ncbi:MAG TPA: molybdopterin-dependent oxidoreductase [Verrucomicrobiae bacterium]|nr:molybdopterin-dependent oxidoreductase [Verrucomicrobiae bacterium]
MPEPLIKLTIDGQPVEARRGTNIIEAAKCVGIEVPHYCYHPKLPVVGNCRMCLVDVGMPKVGVDKRPVLDPDGKPVIVFGPKLSIGCNTAVAEGMVVQTRSPKVVKAREGVMEFLLINHPLDCPICDQAGECRLQEFSEDYGKGQSRFVEEKVHKPKRTPLGPKIVLDDERCILCSRCVRFMKDVAGQDCLGFVNRGSHSTLACYPGQEPNTNYDLNIVDICPVGALTSTDFRFKQRVWFLKATKSVCPNCATGCNTELWSREGVVYRQTPRDNDAVNQCWMCDFGRLHYKFINDPQRLRSPSVKSSVLGERFQLTWVEATRQVAERLAAVNDIAAVASARATTEELFLFNKLVREVLHADPVDCVPHAGAGDAFLLNADRNPNTAGAKLVGLIGSASQAGTPVPPSVSDIGVRIPAIAEGIASGKIRGLIVLGENVANHGIGEEVLAKLELLVVIDALPNKVTDLAHYVLPGATFAEKRGTFINAQGRLQRLNPAIPSPGVARPEWQTLVALLNELGAGAGYLTLEDVFADMARTLAPLAGLNLSKIGDLGVDVSRRLTQTRADSSVETRPARAGSVATQS